jgi:hypothetical protein
VSVQPIVVLQALQTGQQDGVGLVGFVVGLVCNDVGCVVGFVGGATVGQAGKEDVEGHVVVEGLHAISQ